ncbi:HNH endonuclease signature motif containing protein [Aeromicrobium sp.]|uniref:HNH endonuclease signature motif containing protein n=1 Tax=Aeromicrobium sp. TaxID=1871063 RepID=UPI002FC5C6EC
MVAELVPSPPPVVACLDALDEVLDSMSTDAYALLDPGLQRTAAERLRRIKARVTGQELAAIRALDAGLGDKTRTGEVLARGFGRDKHEADRSVRVAKALSAAPRTEDALASGELAETQAAVIAGAMDGLPDTVTPDQRDACETTLIADAKRFPIKDLRQRALRVTDVFKEPAEAAADEDEALRLRERSAWARTEMWMADDKDGTWRFGGRLPALQAEMLKSALDAIAAPRRRHLTAEQERDQDQLTYPQRMGRAFAALIERLPTDKLPTAGGTPAVITVNIDLDDLRRKVGAATLTTGTRISSGELRRLACTQGMLPMVFNGASLPLDMGRSKRLFTPAQRIAIANRDLGCVTPGCEAPPGWCEGHHWRQDWAHGATTNIDDGALLCSLHHHQAHDQDWQFRLAADGIIEVKKPRGLWQRNHRWRP